MAADQQRAAEFFESILIDPDTSAGVRLLSAPGRDLPPAFTQPSFQASAFQPNAFVTAIEEAFQPEQLYVLSPDSLTRILSLILAADDGRIAVTSDFDAGQAVARAGDDPLLAAYSAFADHLLKAAVIPVRRNPLDLASLGGLVSSAGTAGLGALVGLIVSGGSPLAFVTVPVGIVLVMGAKGAGKALSAAAEHHIRRWLRVPEDS